MSYPKAHSSRWPNTKKLCKNLELKIYMKNNDTKNNIIYKVFFNFHPRILHQFLLTRN